MRQNLTKYFNWNDHRSLLLCDLFLNKAFSIPVIPLKWTLISLLVSFCNILNIKFLIPQEDHGYLAEWHQGNCCWTYILTVSQKTRWPRCLCFTRRPCRGCCTPGIPYRLREIPLFQQNWGFKSLFYMKFTVYIYLISNYLIMSAISCGPWHNWDQLSSK